MPKLITFEGEGESSTLPPAQARMSVATSDKEQVVAQFVQQYYSIYDSDSRQGLLEAYHEEALMSMSSASATVVQTGKG